MKQRENILNIAHLLLSQCDGATSRDKRGYDIFDAVTFRKILRPDIFGRSELDDGEIEYLRIKLLRYAKQLRKLGKEFNIPNLRIEETIKKLEEPLKVEYSVICHVKLKDGRYGRCSLKSLDLLRKREYEQN